MILLCILVLALHHYTVTGMDHCDDCQAKIDDNYIAMVGISNSPPEGVNNIKQEDAYRTGQIAWVKKHVADDIFNVKITTPMIFVEPDVIKYLQNLQTQET